MFWKEGRTSSIGLLWLSVSWAPRTAAAARAPPELVTQRVPHAMGAALLGLSAFLAPCVLWPPPLAGRQPHGLEKAGEEGFDGLVAARELTVLADRLGVHEPRFSEHFAVVGHGRRCDVIVEIAANLRAVGCDLPKDVAADRVGQRAQDAVKLDGISIRMMQPFFSHC